MTLKVENREAVLSKIKIILIIFIITAAVGLLAFVIFSAVKTSDDNTAYIDDTGEYVIVDGMWSPLSSRFGLPISIDADKLEMKPQQYDYYWTMSGGELVYMNDSNSPRRMAVGQYKSTEPAVIWLGHPLFADEKMLVEIKIRIVSKSTGNTTFAYIVRLQKSEGGMSSYSRYYKMSIPSDVQKALFADVQEQSGSDFGNGVGKLSAFVRIPDDSPSGFTPTHVNLEVKEAVQPDGKIIVTFIISPSNGSLSAKEWEYEVDGKNFKLTDLRIIN
jgi:hypothetical protein